MVSNNDTPGTIGAITSIVMASVTQLEDIAEIVKIFAGIVGIVAGIFTIVYYHKKIQKINGNTK